jgi:hypothetical protein
MANIWLCCWVYCNDILYVQADAGACQKMCGSSSADRLTGWPLVLGRLMKRSCVSACSMCANSHKSAQENARNFPHASPGGLDFGRIVQVRKKIPKKRGGEAGSQSRAGGGALK